MMNTAKLFSILVVVTLAVYGAVGYYFQPMASFEGDLTRVGMLPESLFGWTRPQPAVPARLFRQASWQEADVLVIGDSFSAPGIWQTALTRRGLRVHTETWTNVSGICEDFTNWTHQNGFKGKYVILEIVERNAEGALNSFVPCRQTSYRHTAWHPGPPATVANRSVNSHSGRLSIGIQVYLNAWRFRQKRASGNLSSLALPGSVHAYHLADGCALFSHPQCEDVLFFDQDRRDEFGPTFLATMGTIGSRVTDATPVWVIVPDKTTTYLHPDKAFWNEAERSFHAPNILRAFNLAVKARVVDLYLSNNTHLSTTGYLKLGETIADSLPK